MASTSGAIRAGRAFVELFVSDNKLYRALNQATARLKATGAQWTQIGAGMAAGGGSVAAPLLKLAADAASRGANIQQLAQRFGLATESVSALAYAFETTGTGLDEFGGTLDGLAAKVKGAADNNEELIQGLRGLNGRLLIKLPLDQQLEKIADKFATITNPIDRATVAQELFGAAGLKLLPVLEQGSEGIRRLKAEAADLGYVMDPETARQSQDAVRGLTAGWMALKSVLLEVGTALLPTTQDVRDLVAVARTAAAGAREWVKANRAAIVTVLAIAAGVVAAGAALVALGAVLSAAGTAIGAVIAVGKALVATVGLIASPIGLVTAAIAILVTQTDAGTGAVSAFREMLTNMRATATETFEGIVAAAKKGDLELAFKIAGTGIKAIWYEMLSSMGQAFARFVEENRTRIVVLGTILGGIKGGMAGSAFGPWGTLIGAVAGGGAGGLGAYGVTRLLDGFGDTLRTDAEADRARAELRDLVARAKEPVAPGPGAGTGGGDDEKYLNYRKKLAEPPPLFNSAKGIFSGPAAQQLAYGDNTAKRQLDEMKGIKKAVVDVGKAIANAPLFKFK